MMLLVTRFSADEPPRYTPLTFPSIRLLRTTERMAAGASTIASPVVW